MFLCQHLTLELIRWTIFLNCHNREHMLFILMWCVVRVVRKQIATCCLWCVSWNLRRWAACKFSRVVAQQCANHRHYLIAACGGLYYNTLSNTSYIYVYNILCIFSLINLTNVSSKMQILQNKLYYNIYCLHWCLLH